MKARFPIMIAYFSVVVACFGLVVPTGIYAKGGPGGNCLPDCFSDTWGPDNQTLIIIGTCQIVVTWNTRLACGTRHDVQIKQLQTSGNCGPGPDYSTLIAQVTEQLLIMNPMGFPPNILGQPCEDNWRVTQGACWYGEIIPYVPEF